MGIKAYFRKELYTVLSEESLVLPNLVKEIGYLRLKEKYNIEGGSLFEVARNLVSRKILAR